MEKLLPRVSVIVPAYNLENTVKQCVDSIIAQDEKNLEIILIDDGSTDKTAALCDEFEKNDDRIKVIHLVYGLL